MIRKHRPFSPLRESDLQTAKRTTPRGQQLMRHLLISNKDGSSTPYVYLDSSEQVPSSSQEASEAKTGYERLQSVILNVAPFNELSSVKPAMMRIPSEEEGTTIDYNLSESKYSSNMGAPVSSSRR